MSASSLRVGPPFGDPGNAADVLAVSGLNVWYRAGERWLHAARDVSFKLAPGESFGLVGESGCGKSTVVHALMGLLPPTAAASGEVRVAGNEVLSAGEAGMRTVRWTDIAIVFQGAMNAFNPVQTIEAQIREPLELRLGESRSASNARTRELLELVGLPTGTGRRFPHELSGGMRQRAAIAMALACRPRVLLADEPTTALDVIVQSQIVELLHALASELGLALVLVTHDLNLIASACTRAAVMYAGRIVEMASVQALYRSPLHPYTRMLFAATPDLGAGKPLLAIPGAPPRLDAPIAGCPFRERCDVALATCAEIDPPLVEIQEGHWAACHVAALPVR